MPKVGSFLWVQPVSPILFGYSGYDQEFEDKDKKKVNTGKSTKVKSFGSKYENFEISELLAIDRGEEEKYIYNLTQSSRYSGGPIAKVRGMEAKFWFLAGYGPTRALPVPKTLDRSRSSVIERLDSLFSSSQISGTNFADYFSGDPSVLESYERILKQALLSHGILPRVKDFTLHKKGSIQSAAQVLEAHQFEVDAGPETVTIPSAWLSQGYQSLISWVADLVGQFFWDRGGPVELEDMEGLVLIDELDIHLHPAWQATLIRSLKAAFPRVQFVVTTHSPMLLPGLERDEIIMLRQDEEGNVVAESPDESPKLMTGSELYESFFGIHELYPREVGDALSRFGYLAGNPHRTDEEEAELQRVMAVLKTEGVNPGWEPKPKNGVAVTTPKPKSTPKAKPSKPRKKKT